MAKHRLGSHVQWCGLRPSDSGQDWSEIKKIGLGLACCGLSLGHAGLVLCCETCTHYARHHNDLERHTNFLSTIYSFSVVCLEHHYCGDQQWRSLTEKWNPPSAFVYLRWSWSCYFGLGLGLKNLSTLLIKYNVSVHYAVLRCMWTGIYSNMSDGVSGMNSLCDEIDLSQFCQHVYNSLRLFDIICC